MAPRSFDKSKPSSRHVKHQSGVLRKYANHVGLARTGAVTYAGTAEEVVCYADN